MVSPSLGGMVWSVFLGKFSVIFSGNLKSLNFEKKGKNRENEVSFLETVNSLEISERFANYIIRGNYPDFISKLGTTNYFETEK